MSVNYIANPSDAQDPSEDPGLFWMYVEQTEAYVWANSFERAFEIFVEWLDDNGYCGHFVTITEDDLKDAAQQLGVAWKPSWPDFSDGQFHSVVQYAEIDHTPVTHTQLSNCVNPAYLLSWTWGGEEITDPDKIEDAARRSFDHEFLIGDVLRVLDPVYLPVGTEVIVRSVSQDAFEVEDPATGDWLELEAVDAGIFKRLPKRRSSRPAPSPSPSKAPTPRASAWAASPEERKRQAEFFKKSIPKLPPGYKGGGFLGVEPPKRKFRFNW